MRGTTAAPQTAAQGSSLLDERPLRILHVLEATLGGTLRYLENIAASLQNSPFELALAYGESRADSRLQPFLAMARTHRWSTFAVPMVREVSLSRDWLAFRQLQAVIEQFRPDLIHCHSSKAGLLGRLAAYSTRPRAAVLYSPHALAVPLGRKYLYIEKAFRSLVDRYIAVSEDEAQDIVHYEVCGVDRVRTVYPAIDAKVFSPRDRYGARTALRLPDAPLVLGMGRLTAQKGPLSFLSILKRVRELIPQAQGLWIGDGDLANEFDALRQELGLREAVSQLPWQHDVRLHLAAADVLLSTSLYESFGYMVAEALAMRVPVVAPDVSGPRDILSSLPEALYPAGDEARAGAMVAHLLANPRLAGEQASLGRNMVAERFSLAAMANTLTALYHAEVEHHRRYKL